MDNKNLNQVLGMFVYKGDNRLSLKEPFVQGEYIIATDAHSAIFIPKALIPDFTDNSKDPPNALKILPKADGYKNIFRTDYLRKRVELLKTRFSKKYKISKVKCPDCLGEGEVEYRFYSDYTHKTSSVYDDCPTCDCEGKIESTINLETSQSIEDDPVPLVNFGTVYFEQSNFEKLISAAELTGNAEIKFTYREHGQSLHKFLLGDIIVLVMPCIPPEVDSENVIVEIKP